MSFYAVAKGIKSGIFSSWEDCKASIEGFDNPIYKKFDNMKEAQDFINDYKNIYVYTDGGCINNGKANALGGIGVFFGINDPRNVSRKFEGKQTNNTAELLAILEAIKILQKEIKSNEKVIIVTDSEYAIKCATTYGEKLNRIDWKPKDGKVVPNLLLVKELYLITSKYNNISYMHIEAHTNKKDRHSFGNSNADLLANNAIGISPEAKEANKKYYLKVPFERKDEAKSLGARWNPGEKKWYYLDSNSDKNKNKLLELFGN